MARCRRFDFVRAADKIVQYRLLHMFVKASGFDFYGQDGPQRPALQTMHLRLGPQITIGKPKLKP